jgi:DNA repair exonuclease SbcCD ATPase subunit
VRLGFTKLKVYNFKTIRGLDFNFDRGSGLHFVCGKNNIEKRLGSNGAGKSSMFDALCFCLFGKTPDGKRGPDLIPWGSDRGLTTELIVTLDDKKHRIFRGHKPNKLTWNGKVVDQQEIEKHIGMNFDTFVHTVLLGQSMPLFFDLTPTEKMRLFNDVLALDRWDQRSIEAGRWAKEYQSELDKAEGWLVSSGERKEQLELFIAQNTEKRDQWDAENATRVEDAQKKLKETEARIAELQRRHDDADLDYDGAMMEMKPIVAEMDSLSALLRAAQRDLAQVEADNRATTKEQNQIKAEIEIADKKGVCPTCKQKLKNDDHIKAFRKRLASLNWKLVTPFEIAVNDLTDQINIQIAAARKFKEKADTARDILDKTIPILAEVKSIKGNLTNIIKRGQEEENPFREHLQQLRKQLSKLEGAIEDNEKRVRILNRKIKRTQFWVKGFKDLELYLIDDVLGELNIASVALLQQLGLVGWSIHYATEQETKSGSIKRGLSVFIQSPHNKEPVRWECWSGGEKQRLKIAGALSLSEVLLSRAGITPTLEILDEPSSHMSTEGVDDLCEFLHHRAHQLGRCIYFADQTVIESSLFSSTVRVVRTKEKGTTLN